MFLTREMIILGKDALQLNAASVDVNGLMRHSATISRG
jgi:hypothetical protein